MFWLFDIISSFLFQYAILLILLSSSLIILRNIKVGIAGLLIGISVIICINPFCLGNDIEAGDKKLSIASINVLSSNFDSSSVYQYIDKTSPDLFFILEYTPYWAKALQTKYGEVYPYKAEQAQWDNFGVALYSKIELHETELIDFTNSYFPVISSTILVDGKTIRVFGTHYENPVGSNNYRVRNHQIQKTVEYLQTYEAKLILGDFNTTPYSRVFKSMLDKLKVMDSRESFGLSGSWPTYFKPLMIPIDHCLHSAELNVTNRILGPEINSDHLPLYVELSW